MWYIYGSKIWYEVIELKKKYFMILLFLITAILFIPSVSALDEGEISSISCKSMTGGVENSKHNATVDKLNINVDDVTFEDVGDYLTCEVIIKNNSEDELSVDLESISNKSDEYITYSLATDGENKVSKNESKKYILDIKYIKEYEEAKTIDNNILIELSGNVVNPLTIGGVYVLVVAVILIVSVIIFIHAKKNKPLQYFSLVLLTALVLVPTVYALTKLTITLNNKIIIEQKYGVYYSYPTYLPVDSLEEEKVNYYKVETEYDYCVDWYTNNNSNVPSERAYSIQSQAVQGIKVVEELDEDTIKEMCASYTIENINGKDYYYSYVTSKEGTYKAGDTVEMVDFKVTDDNGDVVNIIGSGSSSIWRYDENYSPYNLDIEKLNLTEISKMNFSNIKYTDSYSNSDGETVNYALLGLSQTFTMPENNVEFNYLNIPKYNSEKK